MTMNPTLTFRPRSRAWSFAATGLFVLAAVFGLPDRARAQSRFATPEKAADALIQSIATSDREAVKRVLGNDAKRILPLDDYSADDRFAFLEKAHQARSVKVDGKRAELTVGSDPWTLPIPIAQGADGQWRFDLAGGREAILARRIGANELSTIQAALAYVDAQREYALVDRDGDGVLEYAQKLLSSRGKRDGLIWPSSLGDESPLGEAFVPTQPGEGYHGYRFKILTGQGPSARGGARSYLLGKHMVTGFALVAWPVHYGTTGITSFIVNQDGQVFERDLGPNTTAVAATIHRFDPATGWRQAQQPAN
jgi:hypothetical protein